MHDAHESGTIHPDHSDPKSSTTFIVGTVGIVLLLVIVVMLEVLYYQTNDAEVFRKVVQQQPEELRQLQAEQREVLNGYAWVDEANAVVSIPIDEAMRLTVDDLQADRARAGGATPGSR